MEPAKRTAAEQSLGAAEQFERVTDLNFRAGEVPEIDVIRARLQTAARRDDLAQARQAEAIANAALGTLLGYGIDRAPLIETLPQQVDVNELENLTSAGVARRPEFAQLEAQVRAAHADIGVARASRPPKITNPVHPSFHTTSLSPADARQHRRILAMAKMDLPRF